MERITSGDVTKQINIMRFNHLRQGEDGVNLPAEEDWSIGLFLFVETDMTVENFQPALTVALQCQFCPDEDRRKRTDIFWQFRMNDF